MSDFAVMLLCTTLAGSCIAAGGLVGRIERIRPQWLENEIRHSVIAFGGGVLLAAVAFVLAPEGIEYLESPPVGIGAFIGGSIAFFLIERYLDTHSAGAPNFAAMLLDFLPESLALGGMFATGASSAPLLAALIGLQNLPEGFNSFRELRSKSSMGTMRILLLMAALIPLGPGFGWLGWRHGPDHPEVLGFVMLFAAGGIVYLLFQDIAPGSRLERHWAPALGAALGFAVGLLGHMLVT